MTSKFMHGCPQYEVGWGFSSVRSHPKAENTLYTHTQTHTKPVLCQFRKLNIVRQNYTIGWYPQSSSSLSPLSLQMLSSKVILWYSSTHNFPYSLSDLKYWLMSPRFFFFVCMYAISKYMLAIWRSSSSLSYIYGEYDSVTPKLKKKIRRTDEIDKIGTERRSSTKVTPVGMDLHLVDAMNIVHISRKQICLE